MSQARLRRAPARPPPAQPPRKPSLRSAALAARRLQAKARDNLLGRIDWLPPQRALLDSPARFKLLRAGNQAVGKTWAGLAECLMKAWGVDPRTPGRVHRHVWVVCASWAQSVAIQGKLWELAPKAWVAEGQRYDEAKGFGGHMPALRLRNGSTIVIKTTQQGSLNLAGATIDHAMFDEPPKSQRVFAEVVKRVQARRGSVSLTLTPINAPTGWLRELCEAGKVVDLHFPLRPEYLIHERSGRPRTLPDGTVCDAEWIAQVRAESIPYEEPVVVDGEWETRVVGRMFDTFDSTKHVSPAVPAVELQLSTGLDHGSRPGRQAAVLVGVLQQPGERYPLVYVLDETPEATTPTTPEQDADDIMAMLGRSDLTWRQLDYAIGDRPAGVKGEAGRKGNLDIEDGLRRRLGVAVREQLKPRIQTAKRGRDAGAGSVDLGVRWLYHQFIRGRVRIHPRCKRLIAALEAWDGAKDSEHKDIIDALRYALKPWIIGGASRQSSVTLKVR